MPQQKLALLVALVTMVVAAPASADGPPLKGAFGEKMQLHETRRPVPDVAVTTPNGEAVRLPRFRGNVLVVNFWATWCAPCIEEMPALDALQRRMKDAGVHVLAVSQDAGGMKAVKPFLENRVDVPALNIAVDPDGKLARALGVRGLPTTFVVAPDGRIVGHIQGPADWNSDAARAFLRHFTPSAGGNGGG